MKKLSPEKSLVEGFSSYRFIAVAILFVIADFTIDSINHRFVMGDFKVYYGAANAVAKGTQLYGVLFSPGSGYYKYSPFMAYAFYPLSILPYHVACLINFAFISIATILTSLLLLHIFSTYVFRYPVKYPNSILSIAMLCIATHLIREFGLGNVNMFLLLFLSLSLYCILQQKMIPAGILLAIVFIIKPFFAIVLLPLVMRRYFKPVIIAGILTVVFMILPALLLGINKDIELHSQWLDTMLIHANGFPSPNTIEAIIKSHFLTSVSESFQYIIIVIFLVIYVWYVISNRTREKKRGNMNSSNFVMEWFILIAMVPSLVRTDTEHFLVTLPIIVFILIYLFHNRNIPITLFFVLFVLLFAGNSSDLLGRRLSWEMCNAGMLGVGNVLLIALAMYIYGRANYRGDMINAISGSEILSKK